MLLLQVAVRAVAAEVAKPSGTGQPYNRVFNFSAGPANLPLSVLEQAQRDLINWNGSGEAGAGCSALRCGCTSLPISCAGLVCSCRRAWPSTRRAMRCAGAGAGLRAGGGLWAGASPTECLFVCAVLFVCVQA